MHQPGEVESALCCLTAPNPASWCSFLPWVKYVHYSLVLSHRYVSFHACIWLSASSVPVLGKGALTSVQAHLQCCYRIWKALCHTAQWNQHLADRHRDPAPEYQPGQDVWLSTHDLQQQVESTSWLHTREKLGRPKPSL